MHYLRQLIRTVASSETKPVFFDPTLPDATLFQRLYKETLNGSYTSDDIAAKDIYKKNSSYGPYRSLKTELCRRLENLLFFVRFDDKASGIKKAKYKCRRSLFLAWTLMESGAMEAAAIPARRALLIAQRYELSRQGLECAEILRLVAASQGEGQKFRHYNKLCWDYRSIAEAEQKAQEYLDHVYLLLGSPVSESTIVDTLQQYCAACEKYRAQFDTCMLTLIVFRLEVYRCHLTRCYHLALQVCNTLEDFLERKPQFDSPARRGEIMMQKNACRLHLRDYDSGIRESQHHTESFPVGSDNWFAFQQSYFLLALHSSNYALAGQLCQNVVAVIQQTSLFQQDDLWQLYSDFLSIAEGKTIEERSSHSVFTEDKEGMNIPLLLRDIIALLQAGDYEKILLRDEALRKYAQRYIHPHRDRRSAVFIRMIRILLREDFRPGTTKKATLPHSLQLHCLALPDPIEVLPYEVLWNRILALLRNPKSL